MSEAKTRKSIFETPLLRTRIKSSTVSLFPEAALGYLLGPILALLCNGVINVWFVQYLDKVLGLGQWAPTFQTVMPIISAIIIVVGNVLVGRLMERKPTLAGKARPLILISMPIIAVSLLIMFLVKMPTINILNPLSKTPDLGDIHAYYNNLKSDPEIGVLFMAAIGYNLFYAIAWPIYYTSHSGLVNLSTRDNAKRGLLSTAIMAAQLGAAGIAGMAGGFLVDLLHLLPQYEVVSTDAAGNVVTNVVNDLPALGTICTVKTSPAQANQNWIILMIVMVAALVIGCLLEFYFSRERITEEQVNLAESVKDDKETKVKMSEQIKICVNDKYWWMIIIFFFLYQFGGQMKNNDMSFYSQAFTGENSLSGLINTVGAIPTALGMVIVWPLANKITKSKTIVAGCMLAFLGGAIAFLGLIPAIGDNGAAIGAISIGSFIVKALGTAPAMYISLALMANILDHQEAVYGKRTDGFTMAVYGSIMVAMAGVCNGIIVGINSAIPAANVAAKRFAHTFLGFGVEALCYLAMGVMFIFMNVEKFSRIDIKAIVADQKAKVLAEGGEWIEPEERERLENEENERLVEEARVAQLAKDCQAKKLDFDVENAKFLEKKKAADEAAEAKKAAAEAKKAEKLAAMTQEQRDALEAKKAELKQKQQDDDARALVEFNEIRLENGKVAISLE